MEHNKTIADIKGNNQDNQALLKEVMGLNPQTDLTLNFLCEELGVGVC
jgi:hypothetical protein